MATTYSNCSHQGNSEIVVKQEGCYSHLEEVINVEPAPRQLPAHQQDRSPFLYSSNFPDSTSQVGQNSAPPANSTGDLPVSDMDLTGFLDMDDKTLSDLTGVDSNDWTTLFNGQLDDANLLEQGEKVAPTMNGGLVQPGGMGMVGTFQAQQQQRQQQQQQQQQPTVDRWLVEETQRLERQQRLQQQKLLELQQTLLKTEILKNQLQIATISQGQASSSTQMSSTSSMLLGSLGGNSSLPQQHDMMANSPGAGSNNGLGYLSSTASLPGSNCSSNPVSPIVSVIEPKVLEMGNSSSPLPLLNTQLAKNVSGSPSPLLTEPPSNLPDLTQELSMSPPSPDLCDDDSPKEEPNKRKVHNLIEKKYRCSINDRIGILRDMVSKHNKDTKKLQKSAVLQKTIDFIHRLESTIKKLQDENQRLREALGKATGTNPRLPSYSSPPNTPNVSSYESEGDSGHPSSPDSNSDGMLSHNSSPMSKNSFLSQFLRNPIGPVNGAASQYLMMVMLVAVFFVNPLALSSMGGAGSLRVGPHSTGYTRTLNAYDNMEVFKPSALYSVAYLALWALRILVSLLCFGWMTLKAVPRVVANSSESVQYWRYRNQAERNIEQGDYTSAKDNLEIALCAVNRPLPTSYPVLLSGLFWNLFSHFIFELVVGRYAVLWASYFVRAQKCKVGSDPKSSTIVGVSFRDLAETYHLMLQIGLASPYSSHMYGMNFFLGLNALNFAEADAPFGRLSKTKRAEMYFTMGLCCHSTFPYVSSLPKWYYFFRHRATSSKASSLPLKWALTPPGKAFLMSSKWSVEVDVSPKIYSGVAALPTYAVTRSFCKELLCESFHYLLLPDDSPPSSQATRDSEMALQAFKLVLKLAREATSCLASTDGKKNSLEGVADSSDSGFTVVQWWASVGIVSCYWLSGNDSSAECYYANIEALSGEMGAAVPSALQLAFKANRLYKRPDSNNSKKVPVQLVLQLCATTSNSLKSSVANLLQDQSNSTEVELHQLGLLQACDWLLSLKVMLWENHAKENGFSEDLCPGFYQDLETLTKLITLLPTAKSRLHLYKGCYQLIAGANPLMAHAMFNRTGTFSSVRRRANKEEDGCNPALCSHEHAMAKLMAYKHLPPSMESPYSQSSPPTPTKRRSPTLQSAPTRV